MGVVGIVAAISAYVIGKQRGRKRRVDDPTAGANKLIRDPSSELNVCPPTPAGPVELPTVTSPGAEEPRRDSSMWWETFGRPKSNSKKGYVLPSGAPLSPQELSA